MTPAQMDQLMDTHFKYEATDDVEGVLGTLSEHAIHDVVGWPAGPTEGRAKARTFYETMFSDLADGSVRCVKRLYGEDFLIDESVWSGRAVGRPFGLDGRGRNLEFRILHVLEFTQDGMIRKENVWLDLAAITQQLSPE